MIEAPHEHTAGTEDQCRGDKQQYGERRDARLRRGVRNGDAALAGHSGNRLCNRMFRTPHGMHSGSTARQAGGIRRAVVQRPVNVALPGP